MGLVLAIIGTAVLTYFWNWVVNPILNSRAFGFGVGLASLILGVVVLTVKIDRRPKVRVVGVASYWVFNLRPQAVPKESRLQFWLMMPVMLVLGLGFLAAILVGWINTTNYSIGNWAVLLLVPVFLITVPSWLMTNEAVTTIRSRSDVVKSLTARKDSSLAILTKAYSALENMVSIQAKLQVIHTVRDQMRILVLPDVSVVGTNVEPLVWDDEIRSKVEAFFPLVATDLTNSDLAAEYAETLKYVFLKDDPKVLKNMRAVLTGPFDVAYPNFNYNSGTSPFLFDCLIGLHNYDPTSVSKYFNDSLTGSSQMFQALVRSLSLDLVSNLRAKGVVPLVKIDLARKIAEYEGKNPQAIDRATQLLAML